MTTTQTDPVPVATRSRWWDVACVAAILLAVGGLTLHWSGNYVWTTDALFYETKVLQIRGESKDAALDDVWTGPLSQGFRLVDATRPPASRTLSDPEWISYSYRLFDRRWLTPLLGAAAYPSFGADSLEFVTVVGVFVFALLLYVLLRLRFGPVASLIACIVCLAWPPLRWGFMPLADSWALALESLGLIAAVLTMDRGRRWLPLWIAAVLATTVTKDTTPVLLVAAIVVALTIRSRRAVTLAATGILAALPAPLIFGASAREQIAYTFNNNHIPQDTSWGFIISQYPQHVRDALQGTWSYLTSSDPPYLPGYGDVLIPLAIPLLIGIVIVLCVRSRSPRDPLLILIRGALLGGLAYLLILPHFSLLRYELVFLPMAGVGIALGVESLTEWLRAAPRSSAVRPPGAA